MSRETRIFFSRLIIATVFALSILSAVMTHFFITLITVAGGMLIWLIYLLSADLGAGEVGADTDGTLGRNLSKVLAGLGSILAISAFVTYGLEQTMWGSYEFNIQGLAAAMLILLVSIAPLAILQLSRTPGSARTGADKSVAYPDDGQVLPAQPYYPPPYPIDEEEDYLDDDDEGDEEDEEWEDEDEEWDEDEEDDD